ncbi:MAG TPA: hypothetical protein VEL74_05850 [Thermoanaerobaculia bacterium]|nr:hypothetical protein [Thermoanaerobaculia bacterium]
MRSPARPLCLSALLLVASVIPAAAEKETLQQRGLVADANFEFIDAAGCVVTEIAVFAVRDANRSTSAPRWRDSWANVVLFRYDLCQEEFTVLDYASGLTYLESGEAGTFAMSPGLHKATLRTRVEVSGMALHTVDLDLEWSAAGPLYNGRQRAHYEFPSGMTIDTRLHGRQRLAQAAGTVWVSGERLDARSSYGNMVSTQNRTVTITH